MATRQRSRLAPERCETSQLFFDQIFKKEEPWVTAGKRAPPFCRGEGASDELGLEAAGPHPPHPIHGITLFDAREENGSDDPYAFTVEKK